MGKLLKFCYKNQDQGSIVHWKVVCDHLKHSFQFPPIAFVNKKWFDHISEKKIEEARRGKNQFLTYCVDLNKGSEMSKAGIFNDNANMMERFVLGTYDS